MKVQPHQWQDKQRNSSIRLHQGFVLSAYIVTLVMDELSNNIQDRVPQCILFADNIILVETSKDVKQNLNYREALQRVEILGKLEIKLNTYYKFWQYK